MEVTQAMPEEEKAEITSPGKKLIRVLALVLTVLCLAASVWFFRQGLLAGKEADLAADQAESLERMIKRTANELSLRFQGDEAESRIRSELESILGEEIQKESPTETVIPEDPS